MPPLNASSKGDSVSKKILITIVAAIAIVALTFGLSLFAASCGDDEAAAGNGRVAQVRGSDQGDGGGCRGGAQGCDRAADCRAVDNAGACAGNGECPGEACDGDGTCAGTCDGSACTGACGGGACDGNGPCAEAGGAGPFGDEPICF